MERHSRFNVSSIKPFGRSDESPTTVDRPIFGLGTSLALHSAGLVGLALLCRPHGRGIEPVKSRHEVVVLVSPARQFTKVSPLTAAPAAVSPAPASTGNPVLSLVVGRFDGVGAADAPAASSDSSHIIIGTLPGPAGNPITPSGEPGSILVGTLGNELPPAVGPPSSGTGGEDGGGSGAAGANGPQMLSAPFAIYTDEARRLRIHGVVVLKVLLGARSGVHVLAVLHSLGHGLDETAKDAAKAIRFSPALNRAGEPIDFVATVTVAFRLI